MRNFPAALTHGRDGRAEEARAAARWRGIVASGAFHARGTASPDGDACDLRRRSRRRAGRGHGEVKDATVRALKLIAGELDIAQGNLPRRRMRWLATRAPACSVIEHAGTTVSYLGFNLRRSAAGRPARAPGA
jgi:hypothetical protein